MAFGNIMLINMFRQHSRKFCFYKNNNSTTKKANKTLSQNNIGNIRSIVHLQRKQKNNNECFDNLHIILLIHVCALAKMRLHYSFFLISDKRDGILHLVYCFASTNHRLLRKSHEGGHYVKHVLKTQLPSITAAKP